MCASFARSTAHLIVKIRSESAHLIRKFTPNDSLGAVGHLEFAEDVGDVVLLLDFSLQPCYTYDVSLRCK